jgi:hypothetical protein
VRAALAALALAACSGGPPPTDGTGSTGECGADGVDLGTGDTSFSELHDGDTLHMVLGPQGGYHLPLALHGCGVSSSSALHFLGTLGSGDTVVDVSLTYPWISVDRCCANALSIKGYLFVYGSGFSPPDLAGEPIEVSVDVDDPTGAAFHDSVQLVIGAP